MMPVSSNKHSGLMEKLRRWQYLLIVSKEAFHRTSIDLTTYKVLLGRQDIQWKSFFSLPLEETGIEGKWPWWCINYCRDQGIIGSSRLYRTHTSRCRSDIQDDLRRLLIHHIQPCRGTGCAIRVESGKMFPNPHTEIPRQEQTCSNMTVH